MVCFRRWGFEVRCIKCSCLFRIWLVTSFTFTFLLLPRRDRLLSTRVSLETDIVRLLTEGGWSMAIYQERPFVRLEHSNTVAID